MENITFGGLLKKVRVERAGIGLRRFADLVDMQPSNLSNIERNRIPAPANKKTITLMCDTLGLPKDDELRTKFFDLAATSHSGRIPADVAGIVREQPGVPVLVRTVANKQLSEQKLRELAKYIEEQY